jgi:chromosome segregation ATPase
MSDENEFIQLVKSNQTFEELKDKISSDLQELNTYYATIQTSHWSSVLTDTKQKILAAKLQLIAEKKLIAALSKEYGSAVKLTTEQIAEKNKAIDRAEQATEAAAKASAEAAAQAKRAAEELAAFQAQLDENKKQAVTEAATLQASQYKAAQAFEEAQRKLEASTGESQQKDAKISKLEAQAILMQTSNAQLQAKIQALEEEKAGLVVEHSVALAGKEAELAAKIEENARLNQEAVERATATGTEKCNEQLKEIFDVLNDQSVVAKGGSRHKQTRRLRNYF